VIVAVILGGVRDLVQARLEEFDLLRRMLAYREYVSRVPRFLPRLGGKAVL
jgi:protein-S-isoprenylcysteine O-methyltransferase Ste14